MQNQLEQEHFFSERIKKVPRSFIRDILKVAASPGMISFAGGLPNPKYFPVKEIKESTNRVLDNNPSIALQYGLSQGLIELREWIANSHLKQGITVTPEQILITSGSQQALDLIGKAFINTNDTICIEEPSYLGAIQAFSMYSNNFKTVPLMTDGIDTLAYQQVLKHYRPKLTYVVPNFQNPTGTTYSLIKRKDMAHLAIQNNALIIEDDPYGKIRFTDNSFPSIYKYAPNHTIQLGSFSKILAPGFRLGWMVANPEIIKRIETVKQASDLHTNAFCQAIAYDYLTHNDSNKHIDIIRNAYKHQSEAICNAMHKYFPTQTRFIEPQGGMFTWVTMPEDISSLALFEKAKNNKVAFVPGVPFYINKSDSNTLRLNFSCLNSKEITMGIETIAKLI